MRIDFSISQSEGAKFHNFCEAVIRNVGAGTLAATIEAGTSIMNDSMRQVPVDTGTLRDSAFLGISRRDDVTSYRYGAVLGYGSPSGFSSHMGLNNKKTITAKDPGGPYMWQDGKVIKSAPARTFKTQVSAPMDWYIVPNNGINTKNGLPASAYAARVHEDLDMPHPNGGKAKFLEDPIRNWASGRFARTAMKYWVNAITTVTRRQFSRTGYGGRFKFTSYKANTYNWVQRSSGTQLGGQAVNRGVSR